MKLMLTNDDGIDAPGMAALKQAAAQLGEPVVVAPLNEFSGCSHLVTTKEPFSVEKRDDAHYAVDGTPADCVRVGLHHLAPNTDWVLAGINSGGNLGTDVHLSGTVAAIREAVIHGWPGIAVSHYRKDGHPFDWERATRLVVPVLREIMSRPIKRGEIWSINLPDLHTVTGEPKVVRCRLDTQPLPLSFHRDGESFRYNGNYHLRGRDPGSDVDVCFRGNIAVTCINLYS